MTLRRHLGEKWLLVLLAVTFECVASDSDIPPPMEMISPPKDSDAGEPLFLSPFIQLNQTEEGRKQAEVHHPDIPKDLKSLAGYLTVDEEADSNLFFWHIPAAVNSAKAPVILFLEGAPGRTSFFSLFLQHGPFSLTSNGKLKSRAGTWNNRYNMIYIDSSVGTGYSFTDSEEGYPRTQAQIAEHLVSALKQFFKLCGHLRDNDFFVAGESMAGLIIPQVMRLIDQYNENAAQKEKINLKGMIIANGFVDPPNQIMWANFLHNFGLIHLPVKRQIQNQESKIQQLIKTNKHKDAYGASSKLMAYIKEQTKYCSLFDVRETNFKQNPYNFVTWVQSPDVRRALHVGNEPFAASFNETMSCLIEDMTQSQANLVATILKKYRGLIYTSNLDIVCPYSSVINWIDKLTWPDGKKLKDVKRDIWRFPDNESGRVAGYVKKIGNLAEVLVRNSGHFPSLDQPEWILDLLDKFINKKL